MTTLATRRTIGSGRWRPVDRLWSWLSDPSRTLGVADAAMLSDDGNELAVALLRPLAARLERPPGQVGPGAMDDQDPQVRGKAEAVLQHRVELLGGYGRQDVGDPIDWFRAPEGDMQWPTHLSRHYWLRPMAAMFGRDGDEKWAEGVFRVVLQWIDRFPIGAEGTDGGRPEWTHREAGLADDPGTIEGFWPGYCDGPWTSLSAHARFDVWTALLAQLWNSRAATNDRVARLLVSLWGDHCRIMHHFPRRMNQGQAIATSLVNCGLWYPEFCDAQRYERVGWDRIERWATRDIYPDGSLAECSPNYGMGCLKRLNGLVQQAAKNGRAVATIVSERVALAIRYYALSSDPHGRSPRLAKGGQFVLDDLAAMNSQAGHDPVVSYITSGGRDGVRPQSTATCFPWAGHIVARSHWRSDATWLFFDAGLRGSGHHDQAQLALQLMVNGQWLLVDAGFYSYSGEGESGELSRYLRSTAAHSTALVDGRGQVSRPPREEPAPNTRPCDVDFRDDGRTVVADAAYTLGFGESADIAVVHRRRVTYDRQVERIIVDDAFEGDGEHTCDVQWQFAPRVVVTCDRGGAVARMSDHAVRMHWNTDGGVVEVTTHRGQRQPWAGWYSEAYGHREPATQLRVRLRGGLPLSLATRFDLA
jgi:hypothetical protein